MPFALSALDDHIELRGLLGEGGMGEVHRAWDRSLERAVAVKFLLRSAPQEEERLLIEARLQARVDHPRVVRVHEVGTLGGKPCLVLQLVEGRNLGQLAGQLSMEAKVELVRQVALGLHAAHLQGLVHRDVKPSNVLVEDGPAGALSALVTDFGVARDEEGGLTRTGLLPGTLDFMSPEQLAGESPVDFRADVYALGATLYAVLAGRPPFRTSSGPDEVAALVRRIIEDPPPPLTALVPGVRRDLAAIVAKALEKEPEGRYASAEDFADDLGRYQRGEQILARASSVPERALKWARRNRGRARLVMAAALALIVSLAGGLAATYWQWRRAEAARRSAEQRFEEVRHLAGSLVFDVHDAIAKLPGSTSARQMVVARAVEYLDRLSTTSVDERVQAELAAAYLKLSRVQGVDGLGDARAAIASCRKAAALAQGLASGPRATFAQRELMASAQRALSVALANAGESAEADSLILKSVELLRALSAEQPRNPAPRSHLAAALWASGNRRVDASDWAGAYEAHLQSARLYEELAREEPAKPNHRANLALEHRNLAGVALKLGRLEESRSFAERAVAIDRERVLASGDNAYAKADLAISLGSIAEVDEAAGQLEDALARQREALELHLALVQVDPENAFVQMQVASGRGRLAIIHARMGEAEAALAEQRRSVEAWQALVARHQEVPAWGLSLARAEAALGDRLAALPLPAGAPSSALAPEEACGAWLRARKAFAAVRERIQGESLALGEELASKIARCPSGARTTAEGGRSPPPAK
jgi:tetratricopeptide (TPR) repeat protein